MTAEAVSSGLKPHRIVMAAIYAGALAAGWLMLPGDSERVAMLERDGHSREALAILEQEFAGGDRRYRTLYQMQALYESEGNAAKAADLLKVMTLERPRDARLQSRLAAFYRSSQNEAGYLAALQAQIGIRYSEAACRELSSRLRLKGDYVAEQSALQTCRQKGYRRPDDLARLAELVAADGDTAQAVALLRPIDDLKRLKTVRERYQFLSLLLDQDQPKEAERRAVRWIRAAKDDSQFAVGLIDVLARSKYPASAIEVAKDAGSPGDSISLTIAERLIEQTQLGPARLYLKGWLDQAVFEDTDTALRFADAALLADDPETAYNGARKFGLDRLPALQLVRLAAALEKSGFIGDAAEVRTIAARAGDVAAVTPAAASAASLGQVPRAATEQDERPRSSPPRHPPRRVVLPDPLDSWRRGLASKMSDDAQRRLQALAVGPPSPTSTAGTRNEGRGHNKDARPELRGAGGKFLKKASKVLQRAKKNRVLKATRKPQKAPAKASAPGGGPNLLAPGGEPNLLAPGGEKGIAAPKSSNPLLQP